MFGINRAFFVLSFFALSAFVLMGSGCSQKKQRLEDRVGAQPAAEKKDVLERSKTGETGETENAQCEVPHNPLRWKFAACMTDHETDNYDDPKVKQCAAALDRRAPKTKDPCELNRFYKNEWCAISHRKGFVQDTQGCLQDPNQFPSGVELGF